ncbi:MAG: glycosyltransferase [Cyanobacteria bacterium P01_D01_bin.14]
MPDPVPTIPTLSVVLPCLNELRHSYLPRILENLTQQQGDPQLIAVVSPSQDATREAVAQYPGIQIIDAPAQNRAQRLNIGIAASQGEVVILHHPATLLPEKTALHQVQQLMSDPDAAWGGFRHSFDWDHWLLRFTSWYSNTQRACWGQILYLDHCLFARRELLEKIGGVPDMDIFEDTALSQALQTFGAPRLVAGTVTTSARRFQQRGIYRHALLNQMLKLMYYFDLDPKYMNWLYEGKAQINVKYEDSER